MPLQKVQKFANLSYKSFVPNKIKKGVYFISNNMGRVRKQQGII